MSEHRHSPQASCRNFLKSAGLAGAAAAVTPSVAANAVPPIRSEKLNAAVLGPRARGHPRIFGSSIIEGRLSAFADTPYRAYE
jgi:hypothetical protein